VGRSEVIYDGRTIAPEILRNDCKINAGCLMHLRTGAYVKRSSSSADMPVPAL
jgi:hypothetical protein